MKKKWIGWVLIVVMVACKPSLKDDHGAYSDLYDYEWAMNKLWEDGNAEVVHYDAEMVIYGRARKFDFVHLTVKEAFNEAFNVKTNDYDRSDLFSVMKVNKFARLETENYPYHFLTSLFFRRERPDVLHKMTHTTQEWCGNTFKQFVVKPEGYEYKYNSYFDGYGDGKTEFNGKGLVWEDQLSYVLRTLKFSDGLSFRQKVVESQINNKTEIPTVYEAVFSVRDSGENWRVEVTLEEGKANTYAFQKEYPNLMVQQRSWNGHHLTFRSVERYQYWRR